MSDPVLYLLVAVAVVAVLGVLWKIVRRPARTVGEAASPAPLRADPVYVATDGALPQVKEMAQLTDVERSELPWLFEQLTSEASQVAGSDIGRDPLARQRLAEAIVKALIELRAVEDTTINLPYIAADPSGPKHFRRVLTRIEAEAAQP
jgi:hypothetical protein